MCVLFVNKCFCKLKAKAISFCGDLLELLRTIQITFPEVKLPTWGLFSYFIIRIKGCSYIALKLVIRKEILKIKYFQVFFTLWECYLGSFPNT